MLKNTIAPVIFLFCLMACDRAVKFNPNLAHQPNDKATVVFYAESGKGLFDPSVQIPIIANGIQLTSLDTGESVTKYLEPGSYALHSDTAAIDRVTNLTFEQGKLYFIRVWVDVGVWASSVRFTQTEKPEKI